jgi:hypothetical protein
MEKRITTEMLLNPEHGEGITQALVDEVTAIIREELLHDVPETGFVVIPFYDAPQPLREAFNWNGGDEDWLVVTRKEPEYFPNWLERTAGDNDLDVYVLDGCLVYVGSHA